MSTILTFAEQRDGKFRGVVFEVLTAARKLAADSGASVKTILIGSNVEAMASELGKSGADEVFVCDDASLERYSGSAYAKLVAGQVKASDTGIVLFGSSAMGIDLSARVAAILDTAVLSECTGVAMEGSDLIVQRPVYAGKLFVEQKSLKSPTLISLRPNTFPREENAGAGTVTKVPVSLSDDDFADRCVEVVMESGGKVDLSEAEAVVSGGRGLKEAENFNLVEGLAEALGAAVGASRAVVDAGWRPHSEQVGQTGKVVSPNLYIAIAISGAMQHLAGMSGSKNIVAINTDKDAPIFSVANYGIVGDAFEVVPVLIEEIKKVKSSS